MDSYLEICWVIGFRSILCFWLKNHCSTIIYTCLVGGFNSLSLLVDTMLVISFFTAVDEEFSSLYVGGSAAICGWLHFGEVLGKNF